MCRFLIYQGEPILLEHLLFHKGHSISRQAYEARERRSPLNLDGFGVGWYDRRIEAEPSVFREMLPIEHSENLRQVSRKLRVRRLFAHVRDASPQLPISLLNTHPFQFGAFMFMHNGRLQDFAARKHAMAGQIKPEYFARLRGSTDSEYIFYLLLSELDPLGNPDYSAEWLAGAFSRVLGWLFPEPTPAGQKASTVNAALTDGRTLVVSRFSSRAGHRPPSLYYALAQKIGLERDRLAIRGEGENNLVISSEPIAGEKKNWRIFPENHLLIVQNQTYQFHPIVLRTC